MRINSKLINKAELARKLGYKPDVFNQIIWYNRITPEDYEKIKEIFIDEFCYLFECDDIKLIKL